MKLFDWQIAKRLANHETPVDMLAKVGRRGQITIPKSIREKFGIREGHALAFYDVEGELMVRPVTRTLFDWVGTVKDPNPEFGSDWESIMQRTADARAEANKQRREE